MDGRHGCVLSEDGCRFDDASFSAEAFLLSECFEFSEGLMKPVWSSSWRTAFVFSTAPLRLNFEV
jgi:hypothetical protein